jgi:nitrogen fixation NifU-like protein
MMTQVVKGKTRAEAERMFEDVHALVTGHPTGADVGPLKALSGVSRFPLRVKCASLAWHAMKSALDAKAGDAGAVSTESEGSAGDFPGGGA